MIKLEFSSSCFSYFGGNSVPIEVSKKIKLNTPKIVHVLSNAVEKDSNFCTHCAV